MDTSMVTNAIALLGIELQTSDGPARAGRRFAETYANWKTMHHHDEASSYAQWWTNHPSNPIHN